jgi:hypothetical protein
MTWQLQLQLTVERPADDAEAGSILRAWFTGAFEAMGGRLRERLLAAGPLPAYNLRGRRVDEPFGRPGDLWAVVKTKVLGARGLRTKSGPFSEKAWNAFLGRLASPLSAAALSAATLDSGGFPHASPTLNIDAATQEEAPGWLYLNVTFGPDAFDDPQFQQTTLAFVRSFADEWNPDYGEISYDRGSGRTAYENVFWGDPRRTAVTSHDLLRGYAWLTLCPQEIGDRLGGAERLRASGAFAEVEGLTRGGYWLLATPDWRDFDQEAAERIFPVLAPVLRPGEPMPDNASNPPFFVSRRNAAELQRTD